MKTAISVPDPVFERVKQHAERLGISRSEFFATAAQRLADELEGDELTAAINRALEQVGPEDGTEFVTAATRQLFSDGG